jgi:hypothetical protein
MDQRGLAPERSYDSAEGLRLAEGSVIGGGRPIDLLRRQERSRVRLGLCSPAVADRT